MYIEELNKLIQAELNRAVASAKLRDLYLDAGEIIKSQVRWKMEIALVEHMLQHRYFAPITSLEISDQEIEDIVTMAMVKQFHSND